MSSYFKPRRGKKAKAIDVLKDQKRLYKGEIFFEVPDEGVGKGVGKIKMGDGSSNYEDLPYFLDTSSFITKDQEYITDDPGSDITLSQCITNLSHQNDIPTAKGYVYRALDNIQNDFATKQYVDDSFADFKNAEFKVVDTLPATGEKGYIYLVPKNRDDDEDETDNIYDEYVWLGSKYEKIGDTKIDLSGYGTSLGVTSGEVTLKHNNTQLNSITVPFAQRYGEEIRFDISGTTDNPTITSKWLFEDIVYNYNTEKQDRIDKGLPTYQQEALFSFNGIVNFNGEKYKGLLSYDDTNTDNIKVRCVFIDKNNIAYSIYGDTSSVQDGSTSSGWILEKIRDRDIVIFKQEEDGDHDYNYSCSVSYSKLVQMLKENPQDVIAYAYIETHSGYEYFIQGTLSYNDGRPSAGNPIEFFGRNNNSSSPFLFIEYTNSGSVTFYDVSYAYSTHTHTIDQLSDINNLYNTMSNKLYNVIYDETNNGISNSLSTDITASGVYFIKGYQYNYDSSLGTTPLHDIFAILSVKRGSGQGGQNKLIINKIISADNDDYRDLTIEVVGAKVVVTLYKDEATYIDLKITRLDFLV